MKIRSLAACFIFWAFINLCTLVAAAEAPFGLAWGISAEEVRALGADLKDASGTDFGTSFVATKPPKVLSDQEGAILSFGFDNKLWRIVAISRPFSDDPHGFSVKQRYQELIDVLSEKYGKPKSVHQLGDSIYSQPRYFLAGLNGGQSSWFSNFETADLFLQLGIQAADSSTARWRIIFEEKALRRAFEPSKRIREKSTL